MTNLVRLNCFIDDYHINNCQPLSTLFFVALHLHIIEAHQVDGVTIVAETLEPTSSTVHSVDTVCVDEDAHVCRHHGPFPHVVDSNGDIG